MLLSMPQVCPIKNKWGNKKYDCPSRPKNDECVKTKCSKRDSGYGIVKIGNCFNKDIENIYAEHSSNGYPVCVKSKCVKPLAAADKHVLLLVLRCCCCSAVAAGVCSGLMLPLQFASRHCAAPQPPAVRKAPLFSQMRSIDGQHGFRHALCMITLSLPAHPYVC